MQYKYTKRLPQSFTSKNGPVSIVKPVEHNRKYKQPYSNRTKEDYKAYLQTNNWKLKRSQKVAQESYCQVCSSKNNLDVHHLNYRDWYNARLKDLIVLCRRCHYLAHDLIKQRANTSEPVYKNMSSTSRRRRLVKYTMIELGIYDKNHSKLAVAI